MDECIICLEEKEEFVFFVCKHKVCNLCFPILLTYSDKCPLCQRSIQPQIIIHPVEPQEMVTIHQYRTIQTYYLDACKLYICLGMVFGFVIYIVGFIHIH